MKAFAVLLAAGTAGVASADVEFTALYSSPGVASHVWGEPGTTDDSFSVLTGDTVDTAITAFGAGGGTFTHGPSVHTVGGSSILPGALPGTIADVEMTTSVSDAAGIRTLTISIRAVGGGEIAPAGLAVGGLPLESVFFELPDLNGGTDLFDDLDKAGAAAGTFDLIGTDGVSVVFSTAAGITDSGTSFSVGNGVSAGGADIFSVGIGGGDWTISYAIPAPASAALLGLGGLVAARRRR